MVSFQSLLSFQCQVVKAASFTENDNCSSYSYFFVRDCLSCAYAAGHGLEIKGWKDQSTSRRYSGPFRKSFGTWLYSGATFVVLWYVQNQTCEFFVKYKSSLINIFTISRLYPGGWPPWYGNYDQTMPKDDVEDFCSHTSGSIHGGFPSALWTFEGVFKWAHPRRHAWQGTIHMYIFLFSYESTRYIYICLYI